MDQLRTLVAVSDSGSFTAAAAERNVEVSAVSRAMRELEADVGALLFDRLPRGIRMTEAGRSYTTSARDILERHYRATLDARLAASGRTVHFSVGSVWAASSPLLVELLRTFALDARSIAVEVVETSNDDLVARLRSGRLDVAIAATETPPLPRQKPIYPLLALSMWLEPFAVVLPITAGLDTITWRDLACSRLLCRTLDDGPRLVGLVERLGGPTLAFEPHSVSQDGLLGLVAAGMGWTLVPASMIHKLPDGVRTLPVTSPGAALQVEALWRQDNSNSALTRFLALCRQLYAPTSNGDAISQSPDPSP